MKIPLSDIPLAPAPSLDGCPLCRQQQSILIATTGRHRQPLRTLLCPACGLYRTDPLPSAEQLFAFHHQDCRRLYKGSRRPALRRVYRAGVLALHRRQLLSPYLHPGASVLELGCGSGEWLYVLLAAGCRAAGVKADDVYAAFARQEYGVRVTACSVWTFQPEDAPFDLVTLFHVLEHLPDPQALLRRVRTWVREGGLAAIEVPNLASLHLHPTARFHPAHALGFTPESLAFALRLAGWETVTTFPSPHQRNLLALVQPSPKAGRSSAAPEPVSPPGLQHMPTLASPSSLLAYYARPSTHTRMLARLAQRASEWWAVRGKSSPRQILDDLLAAASASSCQMRPPFPWGAGCCQPQSNG